MIKAKVVKVFFVGLVTGLVMGAAAMCHVGCVAVDPLPPPDGGMEDVFVVDSVPPPEPDLLPAKIDPVQACYDIAAWLGDKQLECTNDQQKADKLQKYLEDAWDCPTITGLRNGVELYTVCQVKIKNMSCADFQQGVVPASCKTQLQ